MSVKTRNGDADVLFCHAKSCGAVGGQGGVFPFCQRHARLIHAELRQRIAESDPGNAEWCDLVTRAQRTILGTEPWAQRQTEMFDGREQGEAQKKNGDA